MEYTITDNKGATTTVDAEDWLSALALGLARMKVDVDGFGTVTCMPEADGSVSVRDALGGRSWIVRVAEDLVEPAPSGFTTGTFKAPPVPPPVAPPPPAPAPEIKVMISSRSQFAEPENDTERRPIAEPEPAPIDFTAPPPSLSMPVRASFHRQATESGRSPAITGDSLESLAERLFDLSMDLATMEPDDACKAALQLVLEVIPCEAGSVLRGTINDSELTFVAATGPVADKMLGRTLPFGEGIAGMSYDTRENFLIQDVADSYAHRRDFDEHTGFRTRSTLCVPVLDDEGMVYGVIQLLNPIDRPFVDEDQEAVETIARTLAGALAQA